MNTNEQEQTTDREYHRGYSTETPQREDAAIWYTTNKSNAASMAQQHASMYGGNPQIDTHTENEGNFAEIPEIHEIRESLKLDHTHLRQHMPRKYLGNILDYVYHPLVRKELENRGYDGIQGVDTNMRGEHVRAYFPRKKRWF